MLAECGGCGTRFAWDLPRCPHCGSEERAGEMPKITAEGVSFPEVQEHPGTGEPMTAVEHPADGTLSPETGNEAPEGAPEPVQVTPEPVAPSLPPSAPPLRTPPAEPPGE